MSQDSNFVVIAVLHAKPGSENQLMELIHKTADQSWKEEGVKYYAVHQVSEKPSSFLHVEVYKSKAAYYTHLETSHVKEIIAKVGDLVSEPVLVIESNSLFSAENIKSAL
jgi:quinol monooxygenase YgiN